MGGDGAGVLESFQRGIEGALFYLECAVGDLFDVLCDAIAVE